MNVKIEQNTLTEASPIKIGLEYDEAMKIVNNLRNLIPKGEYYPELNRLLEQLTNAVLDPHFD